MSAEPTPAEPQREGWKPYRGPGGFEAMVGPVFRRRFDDGYRFAFRAEDRHTNARGVVHGGMLMSFVDHLIGATVFHLVGRLPCATASLSCDFLAAAHVGEWIEGEAKVTRRATSLVFMRGVVRGDGGVVLTASGIWKVLGAG